MTNGELIAEILACEGVPMAHMVVKADAVHVNAEWYFNKPYNLLTLIKASCETEELTGKKLASGYVFKLA